MNISFYAGETKEISCRITAVNPDETVVITSASYELFDCKNEPLSNGKCEISGDEITVLLSIQNIGHYTLKLTVQVGRETLIEKADIFAGG